MAPANHARHVEQELTAWPQGMRHIEISVPHRHGGFSQRLRNDFRTVQLVARFLDENDVTQLVFASVLPSILYGIAFQKMTRRLRASVHAVMHSGLAELARPRMRNPLKNLVGLRAAMPLAQATGVRWILLEDAILKNLDALAPRLASRSSVLPHPVPPDFRGNRNGSEHELADPLNIGFLGLGTPQKGLFNFLALARRFAEDAPGSARFRFVGRVHESFREAAAPSLAYLDSKPADVPLRRSDFVHQLESLHLACFLFEGEHYDLTASGVLLDCIGLGIPLLARPHPLIEELTAKHGPIGLIAERGQEYDVLHEYVVRPDAARYAEWRANLAAARESRTPERLAQIVSQILC